MVYRLPLRATLRATQGMLASLLRLMGLAHLPVPDYSTLWRRQQTLEVGLPRAASGQALHLLSRRTMKVRSLGISTANPERERRAERSKAE